MKISEKEKILFENWENENTDAKIFRDGIFDEEEYLSPSNNVKILFLLKEPWTSEEPFKGDLRAIVKDGNIHQTWTNISHWTNALNFEDPSISWDKFRWSNSVDYRAKAIKKIIAVNLKKVPGKSTSKMSEIESFVAKPTHKLLLQKQIKLYNPDVIIGCGSDVAYIFSKVLDIKPSWRTTSRDVSYYIIDDRDYFEKPTPVISFYHPQIRGVRHSLLTFSLIDAWNEINNQN